MRDYYSHTEDDAADYEQAHTEPDHDGPTWADIDPADLTPEDVAVLRERQHRG